MQLTRETAWNLLTEHTKGESLRKHALAVEAAVRGYARKFGEDEEVWGFVALLHDFDYEQYPDLKDHPFKGADILRARGCPEFVVRAILSHGEHTNTPRESRLEHTLFACDEMAGFVTAAALVRPSKSVRDLEAPSVMKRIRAPDLRIYATASLWRSRSSITIIRSLTCEPRRFATSLSVSPSGRSRSSASAMSGPPAIFSM